MGQVGDPIAPKSRGAAVKSQQVKPVAKPWTGSEKSVAVLAYLAIVAYLIEGQGMTGWPPFLIAVVPAILIGRGWKALVVLIALAAGAYMFADAQ